MLSVNVSAVKDEKKNRFKKYNNKNNLKHN